MGCGRRTLSALLSSGVEYDRVSESRLGLFRPPHAIYHQKDVWNALDVRGDVPTVGLVGDSMVALADAAVLLDEDVGGVSWCGARER